VAFLDFIERLERYMVTALDQDNDTWADSTGCACRDCGGLQMCSPDPKCEKLVSFTDTSSKDVRAALNSDAVTHWPDAVKLEHAGCVYFPI